MKAVETVTFKSLDWKIDESSVRMDGRYNAEQAKVEIRLPNGDWKVYRSYRLQRGANSETNDVWYLLIMDGSLSKHVSVGTLENGKKVADADYREYMKNIYEGMKRYIL